jgi:hypothetical protein
MVVQAVTSEPVSTLITPENSVCADLNTHAAEEGLTGWYDPERIVRWI